ncbi:MAG: hypothetical protein H8E48_15045, partial [Chloroflexi bacterium]|nr:hypothetical protein [Chloroflexota bacterium]
GLAHGVADRVDLSCRHALMPGDVAGGLVLAQEAGAKVVDRQGGPGAIFTPGVIVSRPALVDEFLKPPTVSPGERRGRRAH